MLEFFKKATDKAGLIKFRWRKKKIERDLKSKPAKKEISFFTIYRNGGEGFIVVDDLVDTATILDIHQIMVEAVEKKIEGVPNKLKAAKHLCAQILEYKERHSNNNSM